MTTTLSAPATDAVAPPDTMVPGLGLTRNQIDCTKGILIILIAAGHNTLLTSNIHGLFQCLYSFHIFGFLMLPFLFPTKPLSRRAIIDWAVRYLVPYVVFFLGAAVLYYVMFRRGHGLAPWAADVLIALPVASAMTLDAACGFQLYWFLPAFFTLTLFRSGLAGLSRGIAIAAILLICAAHLFIGSLPESLKLYLPFGLPIAVYILPLGLLCGLLWPRLGASRPLAAGVICFIALLGCIAVMVALDSHVNLAVLNLHTFRRLPLLILHDLIPLLAFFAFLGLSPRLSQLPLLGLVGKHSLVIYLVHSVVFQAILRVLMKLRLAQHSSIMVQLSLGAICLAITILLALVVSLVIYRAKLLRRCILPRSLDDWRSHHAVQSTAPLA
jgi:fucose 4-O-acetylase-like acetyltransferase